MPPSRATCMAVPSGRGRAKETCRNRFQSSKPPKWASHSSGPVPLVRSLSKLVFLTHVNYTVGRFPWVPK